MHDADAVGFELGELAHDFVGYEVAAAGFGGEGEGLLGEGHCCEWWWWVVGGSARGGWTAGASREVEFWRGCEGCSEEFEWVGYWFEEELESAVVVLSVLGWGFFFTDVVLVIACY